MFWRRIQIYIHISFFSQDLNFNNFCCLPNIIENSISGSTKLINVAMKPHPSKDLAYVWTITSKGNKTCLKNVWLIIWNNKSVMTDRLLTLITFFAFYLFIKEKPYFVWMLHLQIRMDLIGHMWQVTWHFKPLRLVEKAQIIVHLK